MYRVNNPCCSYTAIKVRRGEFSRRTLFGARLRSMFPAALSVPSLLPQPAVDAAKSSFAPDHSRCHLYCLTKPIAWSRGVFRAISACFPPSAGFQAAKNGTPVDISAIHMAQADRARCRRQLAALLRILRPQVIHHTHGTPASSTELQASPLAPQGSVVGIQGNTVPPPANTVPPGFCSCLCCHSVFFLPYGFLRYSTFL